MRRALSEICTLKNKPVIKGDEFMKLVLHGGLWKLAHNLNLLLQRLSVDRVSKEFQMLNAEYTLGWVDNDAVFIKAFQH